MRPVRMSEVPFSFLFFPPRDKQQNCTEEEEERHNCSQSIFGMDRSMETEREIKDTKEKNRSMNKHFLHGTREKKAMLFIRINAETDTERERE